MHRMTLFCQYAFLCLEAGSSLPAEHGRGRDPRGQHQHVLQLRAHQARLNWLGGGLMDFIEKSYDCYYLHCTM